MKRNIVALVCMNLCMVIMCTTITVMNDIILSNGLAIIVVFFNAIYLSLLLWLNMPTKCYPKPKNTLKGGIEL